MTDRILYEFIFHNIIQKGKFTLKNGTQSDFYINLKTLPTYTNIFSYITNKIVEKLNNKYLNERIHVIGIPYGAISIATKVAYDSHNPFLIIRKEQKNYGTKKLIEGDYKIGDKVVIIEDVVTTGSSIKEQIENITGKGLVIDHIFTIFDRRENNKTENISSLFGYDYTSLFTMNDINNIYKKMVDNPYLPLYRLLNTVNITGSKIIFSCDVTTMDHLCYYAELCGPYISILKVHTDSIKDFDIGKMLYVRKMAEQFNFLIMEDRKFGDIGSTLEKQLDGIFQYKQWCDLVTAYPYIGQSGIDIFRKNGIGVFLIAELSINEGQMMPYKELYNNPLNSDVIIGTIGQNHTGFIQATPGIHLNDRGDNMNQCYKTPQVAGKKGANMFIIGRDIYNSKNPLEQIKKYYELTKSI